MRTAELDTRDGAWGFPKVSVFHLPEPGDQITLPGDKGVFTVLYLEEDMVTFGAGRGTDNEDALGHLRMSATGDGLYLFFGGSERDGYSCSPATHNSACGECGARHAKWTVQRGRP